MPQKLAIVYKSDFIDEDGIQKGVLTYQMTLNLPSFSKASFLYTQLIHILSIEKSQGFDGNARGKEGAKQNERNQGAATTKPKSKGKNA